MTKTTILVAGSALLIVLVGVVILIIKRPKKLKTAKYVSKWREVQSFCKERTDWPKALHEADKLLDCVLKKKRYKGKTMGARLMAAQRQIKDNDGIWAAHKLVKNIIESEKDDKGVKLAKAKVKTTLQSYQEALVDLGALRRRG